MAKVKETEGKEQESEWIEEKMLADAQQLDEVREKIAELTPDVEHVEEEPQITTEMASVGAHSPQQQAAAVVSSGPTIILPLTSDQIKKGLHQQIFEAIRWLAVWCIRIAEMARAKGLAVIFGRGKPATDAEIAEDKRELAKTNADE